MDRSTALKKLTRILGKRASWRVYDAPSSPDKRQAAMAEKDRLKADVEAIERRRREILDAIPELKELHQKERELRKALDRARSYSHYYRYIVGINIGIGLEVKAEGDSWEDIFRRLEQKKADAS